MIPIILFTFLSQILAVISSKVEPPAYCLQDRSSKAFKECQEFNEQFCENVSLENIF